jgi:uncharacterized protein (TIGR02246 family)
LFAALAAAPAALQAAPAGPEDRAALERLAAAADLAWNRRDAAAMSGFYAADANLRLGGMADPVTGREAVRAYFERAFAARAGEMRHITVVDDIDVPRPGMAVSDATVRVEQRAADGSWRLVRSFANTSVAIREQGAWKLAAVRAHLLPPPGEAAGRP